VEIWEGATAEGVVMPDFGCSGGLAQYLWTFSFLSWLFVRE
jgi:hypothetical protein